MLLLMLSSSVLSVRNRKRASWAAVICAANCTKDDMKLECLEALSGEKPSMTNKGMVSLNRPRSMGGWCAAASPTFSAILSVLMAPDSACLSAAALSPFAASFCPLSLPLFPTGTGLFFSAVRPVSTLLTLAWLVASPEPTSSTILSLTWSILLPLWSSSTTCPSAVSLIFLVALLSMSTSESVHTSSIFCSWLVNCAVPAPLALPAPGVKMSMMLEIHDNIANPGAKPMALDRPLTNSSSLRSMNWPKLIVTTFLRSAVTLRTSACLPAPLAPVMKSRRSGMECSQRLTLSSSASRADQLERTTVSVL